MALDDLSRREFAGVLAVVGVGSAVALPAGAQEVGQGSAQEMLACALTINGEARKLEIDPRVTLLDLLRENLQLSGTKKGCDHGQCGACTVLVNGRRVNSCLTLAVMHEGDQITTIEGLATGEELHPMQAAFIEHDGLQCGYCTPGQICSAVALLAEAKAERIELTDAQIRERMSGNICRCGAYVGIVNAIRAVAQGRMA